jgi:hypothetical protein
VTAWAENEDGPDCACGNPTVVKITPGGQPVLMCLFHTAEAGLITVLPLERPGGWPAIALQTGAAGGTVEA